MKQDSFTRTFVTAVADYYKIASRTEIVATIMVLVGVLNFMAFMAFSMSIGGSAANGEIRGGRYFVNEHGKEHEVTAQTYELNQIHGGSLWISHSITFLGIIFFTISSSKIHSARHLPNRNKKPNKAQMATPRKPSD